MGRLDWENRALSLAKICVTDARQFIREVAEPGTIVVEVNRKPLADPSLTSRPLRKSMY